MMFSVLLLFVLIGTSTSCSCNEKPPISEEFVKTEIIFIGHVINVTLNITKIISRVVELTMLVEEAFKVRP
jgi:hypothetical protein